MKKLIVAAILGTVAVLGSASIAAADLVNVHLHGLNNAGRVQVHIHNIVHNVRILDDTTLTFDIDP